MPTIRLIPSTYYLSNSSYLSVSDASNMYTNTDSNTYSTTTNSRTSTSSYYIYLRGFNFDDVPANAIVSSFSVKFKARESGVSTSSSYRPYMCHGTTTITGTVSTVSTTATVHTFSDVADDWETISGYGENFGIRFNCRRASRNTTSHLYLYGAEIEVEYTVPTPATVTSTLVGDGTINPSGAYETYEGAEYTITVTPTDKTANVSATKDGAQVELVAHGASNAVNTVLGDYTLISGGFNSGESYFEGLTGNGVNASQTSSNYYSSSSSTHAVFTYDMHFSLPSNAQITRVYCQVNGHAESTSQSSEYMCVQLKSGNVELSEEINFKTIGTSNTTITLEADTLPTVNQLANMVLECTLGYYGGAINGATCYVEYDIPGANPEYYTYTFIVTGNTTIAVVIGADATSVLYVKLNNTWQRVVTAYVKQSNNTWAVEADVTAVFNSTTNYKRGN